MTEIAILTSGVAGTLYSLSRVLIYLIILRGTTPEQRVAILRALRR